MFVNAQGRLFSTRALLLVGAALAAAPALAQTAAAPSGGLDEIVVTAERRSENLQKVPVAIIALGTEKLGQLQVSSFNDYAKFLPSLSFDTAGPGSANVYFRGVASGGDGNHSGPLPSVGIYLDEQPITTIGGALDLHVYDIARVEALAGPQGTLYGASSQAGTIRIITNKPELGKTSGAVNLTLNKVSKGGVGGTGEAYVNLPVSDNAALRVVGWYDHRAGYIDNVPGSRTYPISGITINNAGVAKNNYNDVDVVGGRAALRVEAGDWTFTPTIMGQSQISHGIFGQDPNIGDLAVTHFNPERFSDKWAQAALTIEGKISDFDVVYSGSYLERKQESASDYSDYTLYYDYLSTYIKNDAGKNIDPTQRILGNDKFSKMSQELRISSPTDKRFRVIAGAFYQRQTHDIQQDYAITGLGTKPIFDGEGSLTNSVSVGGHPGTFWLTKQYRIDRDYALFGQAAFDITDNLTLTGGGRLYKFDNSLIGFFGFGKDNFAGSSGENICFGAPVIANTPCTNLGVLGSDGTIHPKQSKGNGFIHKLNLAWQATPDILVYGTWSRGFRPGGINRRGTLAPYDADYLTNYEIGFKGSFADRRVRFNAAIFQEEWKGVQLAFLGANSLTEIQNAGNARIRGIEGDLTVAPLDGLTLTASGTYTDAHLTTNYCRISNSPDCSVPGPTGKANFIKAPIGQALPVTPDFKGSFVGRYEFDISGYDAHVQAAVSYVGARWAALVTTDRDGFGQLPAYTTADFTFGGVKGNTSAELFLNNAFDSRGNLTRYSQCGSCSAIAVYQVVTQPRTFGIRFGQRF
ncbi:MAG: TonB-dependent receptor [Sandarakinorhabdus sp.]|nr:TonB-dependent receptor [Sandarakinorhabdus sp.]